MFSKVLSALIATVIAALIFAVGNITLAQEESVLEICFPQLVSPKNKAVANDDTYFTWTPCPAVNDSYEVWIYNYNTNSWGMFRTNGTSTKIGFLTLEPGKNYRWKVRACYSVDCTEKSKASKVGNFIWSE